MRSKRTRSDDATFELNLAPFLDIIVSIIPMLLLSIAFVQVKMIEAPTPQLVSADQKQNDEKPVTQVTLRVSKKNGFTFEITDPAGKVSTVKAGLTNQQLDYEGLMQSALKIKSDHPEVVTLQLVPESDVQFEDLVKVMDQVRLKPRAATREKVSFSKATGEKPKENLDLFPDVVFSSIGG